MLTGAHYSKRITSLAEPTIFDEVASTLRPGPSTSSCRNQSTYPNGRSVDSLQYDDWDAARGLLLVLVECGHIRGLLGI